MPDTTTYTAAVAIASSVVAGDHCDLSVAPNRVATYREDDDGNETPVYEMTDNLEFQCELGVRTADDDAGSKACDAADDALSARGWRRTGPWEYSADAAYAPVERVEPTARGFSFRDNGGLGD